MLIGRLGMVTSPQKTPIFCSLVPSWLLFFFHKALFYPAPSETSEQMPGLLFQFITWSTWQFSQKLPPGTSFLSGHEHLSLGPNLTLQPSFSQLIMYLNLPDLWPFQHFLWSSTWWCDRTSPGHLHTCAKLRGGSQNAVPLTLFLLQC